MAGNDAADAATTKAPRRIGSRWFGLDVVKTMIPTPYILPVELIYRALACPRAPEIKPQAHEPAKIELTRADVDQIIHRKRAAAPEELEEIIDHGKQLKLTDGERNQLCCDLTISMSQRRQVSGRRDDPSSKLIHDLGYAVTPFGLLPDRAWYQKELQTATKAIAACRRHIPPQCSCWREARVNLYGVRESFGEKSPESWAALKVWEALEEIEISSRPDREPSIA
jgi:hypothetical protein